MSAEDKGWLNRRVKTARNIEKRLGNALDLTKKLPEFDGRSQMIDCLVDVKHLVDKLKWDLEQDDKESVQALKARPAPKSRAQQARDTEKAMHGSMAQMFREESLRRAVPHKEIKLLVKMAAQGGHKPIPLDKQDEGQFGQEGDFTILTGRTGKQISERDVIEYEGTLFLIVQVNPLVSGGMVFSDRRFKAVKIN